MSCSTIGFNLVNVLHILKYYLYLYILKASRRVVGVFCFVLFFIFEALQNVHKQWNTPKGKIKTTEHSQNK